MKTGGAILLVVALVVGGVVLLILRSNNEREAKDVAMAKYVFMARAGSASVAEQVDRYPYRLDGKIQNGAEEPKGRADLAEEAFMTACKQCAAAELCERDRLSIRSGQGSDKYNPCE